MPIPVGRSGNVDSERGTTDGAVRAQALARGRWLDRVRPGDRLRVWVEPERLQRRRPIRGARPARLVFVDRSGEVVFTAALEPEPRLEELTNDADYHGTDDALSGA